MSGRRIGATILAPAGPELGADEAAFFRAAAPWGFILFARNLQTPEQIRRLTASLREAVGRDAPIFIDQEGGRVARLVPPLARAWPAPLDMVAATGERAPRALWIRGRIIAEELRALGIDGNCVPVADIARPETHPFLRNRCLGHDASTVARNARALAEGTLAGGVLPVVKHVPGHGRARTDSHAELPVVDAAWETLTRSDLASFRALADLPLAMTAHVVYRAIDPRPATLSPRVLALVREEIGFQGLLMSDDISMGALVGPLAERTAAARAAGCDLILHCNGRLAEMEAVATAAGVLAAAELARAEAALAARRHPVPVDIAGLEAELEAMSGGER